MQNILGLRSGEIVEVRSEQEIHGTLDANGMFEGIPFMPEMREFCGRTFRVFKRADKICVEGKYVSRLRDTIFLEDVRCDGARHDGCKRMCLIFWKEVWLKRAKTDTKPEQPINWLAIPEVNSPPFAAERTYFCQSTALPKAVEHLSGWDVRQYLRDINSRSFTPWQVCKAILINTYNRIARRIGGHEFGTITGSEVRTPMVALGLKQGDLVQIKSPEEIATTLDANAKNRGLQIDYEMLRHAGKRFRVLRRVDRIILETNGKMREIKNTVLLDNGGCEGLCRRACARTSHGMWREAWLTKVDDSPNAHRGE